MRSTRLNFLALSKKLGDFGPVNEKTRLNLPDLSQERQVHKYGKTLPQVQILSGFSSRPTTKWKFLKNMFTPPQFFQNFGNCYTPPFSHLFFSRWAGEVHALHSTFWSVSGTAYDILERIFSPFQIADSACFASPPPKENCRETFRSEPISRAIFSESICEILLHKNFNCASRNFRREEVRTS